MVPRGGGSPGRWDGKRLGWNEPGRRSSLGAGLEELAAVARTGEVVERGQASKGISLMVRRRDEEMDGKVVTVHR